MLMLGLKGVRSEEKVDNNNKRYYTVNSLLAGHLWSWHEVSVYKE